MRFDDLDAAFTHIESFMNLAKLVNYTVRTYRLDRMHALLDHFGHPERAFNVVHVAGSKGKGSTCTYIAQSLTALGFRTGIYLSPHIVSYRERFTCAGEFFSDESILETIETLFDKLEGFHFAEETGYTEPTTFELLTLLGFLLFKRHQWDWAVIGTGLAGRCDATNVVEPEISVITPIELEHTAILGDTITKIATEKAGIIKSGKPVVFGLLKEDAEAVVRKRAEEMGSLCTGLTSELLFLTSHTEDAGESVSLGFKDGTTITTHLAMHGGVQAENAALAVLTLKTLGIYDAAKVIPALQHATLPGRMEKVSTAPPIYIDGANTGLSLQRLLSSFRELYPTGGVLIFGVITGKDPQTMVRTALKEFDRIIVARPGTFKESHPDELAALLEQLSPEVPMKEGAGDRQILLREVPSQALSTALACCHHPAEPILITGSFYLAAELRRSIVSGTRS